MLKMKSDEPISEKEIAYLKAVNDLYRVGNGELLDRLIKRLEVQGLVSKGLDQESILEGCIKNPEKEIIGRESRRILGWRASNSLECFEGYHTSPADLKIGSKVGVGEDGKAYFSDQYSLYSRGGTVNFVYLVSADAKIPDEKEPAECNGRFYARRPLTILRKWEKEKFMEEHPGASFRDC